jgi:hypothetical protein
MTSIKPWVTCICVPQVNCVVNQPQRIRAGTEIERFVFVLLVVL